MSEGMGSGSQQTAMPDLDVQLQLAGAAHNKIPTKLLKKARGAPQDRSATGGSTER